MKRDFTEAARQELLATIRKINDDQFCGLTDWVGDAWLELKDLLGGLDIDRYMNDLKKYHQLVLDKNDTSEAELNKIWENVNYTAWRNKVLLSHINSSQDTCRRYINRLTNYIDPSKGIFQSAAMNGSMAAASRNFINTMSKEKQYVISYSSNPAFDCEGSYGGDQAGPWHNFKDPTVKAIVMRYHPNWSDAQIKKFLEELNNEGCGYVALTNTLFNQFVGREDDFMEIFGFPMYTVDGELNYNPLIADLYCAKDNPNTKGTTVVTLESIWESYLSEHGIGVDVVRVEADPSKFNQQFPKGQLIIGAKPVILQNADGKIVSCSMDSGHAMTITGVTQDGRYIVSSWGKKYYIDRSDYYNENGSLKYPGSFNVLQTRYR